jgi:hypothetical protein
MAGQFSFGLSCFSIDPSTPPATTQAQLAIAALSETFLSSTDSVTPGASFTLSWSTTGATSCTASGGGADGSPWSGTLAPSGSLTQSATSTGTFNYQLTCSVNNEQTEETVTIKVMAAAAAGGGPSGGGGALDVLELALLALLVMRAACSSAARAPSSRARGAAMAAPELPERGTYALMLQGLPPRTSTMRRRAGT